MDRELKHLRKRLYTYHNQLQELEEQSRLDLEDYDARERFRNKRARLDNYHSSGGVLAFDTSSNNPLQNEYILEMVTTYLPSQSLRKCRLVCRLWDEEMSRSLRSRKNLIVTDENYPEAISILQKAKKTSVVPLGSICFFDVPPSGPVFKKLMASFGCTLSCLKLEECQPSAQDLASILTSQAPHLETFYYKDRALPESQRVSTFKMIKSHSSNSILILPELKRLHWNEEFGKVELEEIIAMFPNLVDLVYKNIPVPDTPNYKKLRWDSLRTLRLSPRDELQSSHIKSLTSLKLKLRILSIIGVNPKEETRMKHLGKFLKSISGTLIDLELFQHHSITPGYNTSYESPLFVELPHLSRLDIDFALLKSVKTFNYFPQLKSLDCKARVATDWGAVGKGGFPTRKNQNLTRLNLGRIDQADLILFAHSFSSCKSLELDPEHVGDSAMRIIIRCFPQLQQLKIARHGCSHSIAKLPLTDTGLTGFNISTCRKLCKDKVTAQSSTSLDGTSKRGREFPAIYQLKELNQLEIHADESFITDVSVVYGIAKCTKLHILGLPKCNISDLSLKAIQDNLQLTILDVPKCCNFSQSALTSLKNAHKAMILQPEAIGFPGRNLIR